MEGRRRYWTLTLNGLDAIVTEARNEAAEAVVDQGAVDEETVARVTVMTDESESRVKMVIDLSDRNVARPVTGKIVVPDKIGRHASRVIDKNIVARPVVRVEKVVAFLRDRVAEDTIVVARSRLPPRLTTSTTSRRWPPPRGYATCRCRVSTM
jgi:hypothetical protein